MKNKNLVLTSVAIAMLAFGLGFSNTARAEFVDYGDTAYGPAGIQVEGDVLKCKTASYMGSIADPEVLVSYLMTSGLKRVVVNDITPKDAMRIFDSVNMVDGVRATYLNAQGKLILTNIHLQCCIVKHGHHMKYIHKDIVMKGVIAERVSGDSVIGASSMAPGFVASTSSDGSFISSESPTLQESDYITGEGETPLYTR